MHDNTITYQPIGIIHSPFKQPKGVPIQPHAGRDIESTVDIFPQYVDGLKDLEGFSHIILIYHFHLSIGYSLKVVPYMDDTPRGVFATRAPSRPNPIGMSVVRLDRIDGNVLYVRDIDIVDNTPLLDIKPYVPAFEKTEEIRTGWLVTKVHKLPDTKDDGRFTGDD
jgi:tRNA-Thr(GGU) m(6)t(6)A37 methyltransferase TsaA